MYQGEAKQVHGGACDGTYVEAIVSSLALVELGKGLLRLAAYAHLAARADRVSPLPGFKGNTLLIVFVSPFQQALEVHHGSFARHDNLLNQRLTSLQ